MNPFDFQTATPHEAATYLVSEGFTVLPIKLGAKKPPIEWKPLQLRQPTEKELKRWFLQHDWQVGIICGTLSNTVVLDCDTPKAVEWAKNNMPPTPLRTVSGSGRGMHFWYRQPENLVVTNARSAWVLPSREDLEIDIRGQGGQVLAPGALHKSNNRYRLDDGSLPLCRATVNQLPFWPVEQLQPPPPPQRTLAAPLKDRLPGYQRAVAYMANWKPAVEGQGGDVATFANACALVRGFELRDDEAMDLLLAWNQTCVPPWTEGELWVKIQSARAYGTQPMGYLLNQEPEKKSWEKAYEQVIKNREKAHDSEAKEHKPPYTYHRTDLGNAQLFVDLFGHDYRYCHTAGAWWCWDTKRWASDTTGRSLHAANQVARIRQDAAHDIEDKEERKAEFKHAFSSESRSKRDNTLAQALSIPGVSICYEDLDTDPWILCCENGTLDLKTGLLREHRRADFCSQLVPVKYDPAATCPTWEAFLAKIMGDSENLVGFLRRAIGYSLTGCTREQVLFILWGSGRNGKSVLLETLLRLLGTYGQVTSPATLMVSQSETVRNDLARLRGARFVKAVETSEGKRLDEGLIKQVTGCDRIPARFLFQEYFEFDPQLKLWLATNHKPSIRGQDLGIWRRIRLIPFAVVITEAEDNKDLQEALITELPGILNWALRGCLEWQRVGLAEPPEVVDATKEYRDEEDVLGRFLSDCCVTGPALSVGSGDLYAAYRDWAKQAEEWCHSHTKFSGLLKDRGFKPDRKSTLRQWLGLGLAASRSDDEAPSHHPLPAPGRPRWAGPCDPETGLPVELF